MLRMQGPVIRVSPNELSFADPGAVREIYTSNVFIKEESFYVSIYFESFQATGKMNMFSAAREADLA